MRRSTIVRSTAISFLMYLAYVDGVFAQSRGLRFDESAPKREINPYKNERESLIAESRQLNQRREDLKKRQERTRRAIEDYNLRNQELKRAEARNDFEGKIVNNHRPVSVASLERWKDTRGRLISQRKILQMEKARLEQSIRSLQSDIATYKEASRQFKERRTALEHAKSLGGS
jgi:chromosome segregation ATPase